MKDDILLKPYQLSASVQLPNRIIMAPLTRRMAGPGLVPTDASVEYYQKRADAGLIVTEGTLIRPDAQGYPNIPGIFNQQHIEAWQRVTDAVHQRGGRIFMQLWHVGRVAHPDYLNGSLPVSPSATQMTGSIPRLRHKQYGWSRALTVDEIKQLVEDYANAAGNARQAGFDGVEIHGANGYLIDQFLHYNTNLREDAYGGDAERMSRFAIEVVEAVGQRVGYDRTGIRLSPAAYINEIEEDPRDAAVQRYLLQQLNELPIAYVHTGNFDDSVAFESLGGFTMTDFLRQHYQGNLIAAGGYTFDSGRAAIEQGRFNLLALGRAFIANPDLMQRFRQQQQLFAYEAAMLESLI